MSDHKLWTEEEKRAEAISKVISTQEQLIILANVLKKYVEDIPEAERPPYMVEALAIFTKVENAVKQVALQEASFKEGTLPLDTENTPVEPIVIEEGVGEPIVIEE